MPIPRAYRNSRNAPWEAPEADECPECQETIINVDSHAEDCRDKMTPEELAEYLDEMAQPEYNPIDKYE